MLDTRVFVNYEQIGSMQIQNVTGEDVVADYKVTLREGARVRHRILRGFDRSRGAWELIHDAVELMRET